MHFSSEGVMITPPWDKCARLGDAGSLDGLDRDAMDRSLERESGPYLQLAVDALDTAAALQILDEVHPHCDIVEIGTPLIIEEGLGALEALKSKYSDKLYLADTKIMDAGRMEAESAFRRGADIVTVLALADDQTIRGAVDAASAHRGRIMIDLINAPDPLGRAAELEQFGVHVFCLHTAYDRQKGGELQTTNLRVMRESSNGLLAIAGGIKLEHVRQTVLSGADIVVVGGGIISQPSRDEVAANMMEELRKAGHERN